MTGEGEWLSHAARLLRTSGASLSREPHDPNGGSLTLGIGTATTTVTFPRAPSADADWATSGAMALTGLLDGPPLLAPAPLAAAARGAAGVLALLSKVAGREVLVDGPALLGERAALARLTRRGRDAPGGHCRLLRTAEGGWCALSLARPEDRELAPALVGRDVPTDRLSVWSAVADAALALPCRDFAKRARLLGLPAAPLLDPVDAAADEQARARDQRFPFAPWLVNGEVPASVTTSTGRPIGRPLAGALVVDCSSLWAGPLCAQLLGLAGCRVVKVEDPSRPDGARRGPPEFYDLLHGGHESVAVDLRTDGGRDALAKLLGHADVVIEGSRPRAFEQLGIDRAVVQAQRPSLVWLSITGYGATGPGRNWAALGDDAAVAAGLVAPTAAGPVLVGDAIADPLAGLHAGVAVVAALLGGEGVHIDLALREVVGSVLSDMRSRPPAVGTALGSAAQGWHLRDAYATPVAPPRARLATTVAPTLGAHTEAVLTEVGAS